MPYIGLKNPYFGPLEGDGKDGAVYGTPIKLGGAVAANMTVTTASGEFYSDDALTENVSEFVSALIAMELSDLDDEPCVVVLHATKGEDGELRYNVNDVYPFGGIGYYKRIMKDGKVSFKAFFYPKCKAAPVDDKGQTKSNSVTFQTSTVNFTVYAPASGDWKMTQSFDNEADALAWVLKKYGADNPPQGPGGSGEAASV